MERKTDTICLPDPQLSMATPITGGPQNPSKTVASYADRNAEASGLPFNRSHPGEVIDCQCCRRRLRGCTEQFQLLPRHDWL